MRVSLHVTIPLAALLLGTAVARAEPPKAAVFDFQLANLGAQGPTEADVARLGPLSISCEPSSRNPAATPSSRLNQSRNR